MVKYWRGQHVVLIDRNVLKAYRVSRPIIGRFDPQTLKANRRASTPSPPPRN